MISLKKMLLLSFLIMSFSVVHTERKRVITFEEEIQYKETRLETLKSKIKVEIAELKYKNDTL